MSVYELEPRVKIGSLEIGRRRGRLVGLPDIDTPRADFILKSHPHGWGESVDVIARVIGPNSVAVVDYDSYSLIEKSVKYVIAESINQGPVGRRLRWFPD